MLTRRSEAVRDLLLDLLERGYRRVSWHGPNLKGSIRGLTATTAAWRPSEDRRSIAEIVVHAAYWKYTIRRRLLDEPRGSFDLTGSNWFPIAHPLTAREWNNYRALLDAHHERLIEAISIFPTKRWHDRPKGSRFRFAEIVEGIAAHDVYHAGQIQLLKRLARDARSR